MCWKKKQTKLPTLNSEEYLSLQTQMNKLRLQFSSLELDLQLYVKKLKATRGLKEDKSEDSGTNNESFNNSVILAT
jgi:hypothetical protein